MPALLGAIIGDISGSKYEFNNNSSTDIKLLDEGCYFTDDTVLSLAIAYALKHNQSYKDTLRKVCSINDYVHTRFFGPMFVHFVETGESNYSFGNGSAIRVSYIGETLDSLDEVLTEAKKSAVASHTHPDAIAGAQCIAGATFLAKSSKDKILDFANKFYDVENTEPGQKFDSSCSGSVPLAVKAALETSCFKDAIKTAISYGGDTDSIAAMAGSIAGCLYPDEVKLYEEEALAYLDDYLRTIYLDVT